MDDLKAEPASACFLLLPVPTFAQVHEAIKQTDPDLQDIAARKIDIYLQEARSPRLPVLLALSLASDAGRLESGNASEAHRPPCVRTPASPTLGSVIGHLTST